MKVTVKIVTTRQEPVTQDEVYARNRGPLLPVAVDRIHLRGLRGRLQALKATPRLHRGRELRCVIVQQRQPLDDDTTVHRSILDPRRIVPR